MNYRSVSDLSRLVSQFAGKVPSDVEVIVGIPRSGMLAASIIALKLNLPLIDLYSFMRNDELKKGQTRTYKQDQLIKPLDAKKILLVDDSVASGQSIADAVGKLRSAYTGDVVTLAAFAMQESRHKVDLYFELLEQPRVFEWNIMHHSFIGSACLDIDGVLCDDPTAEDNDDGPAYVRFLQNTKPLVIPSVTIKHLVTSRLEKYRPQTEEWLKRNGVQYEKLHMLDLPTAEERRRLQMHHKFKAQVYASDPSARLFIESEVHQAREIMRLTSKPVYCIEDNIMYTPGMSLSSLKNTALRKGHTLRAKVVRRLKRLLTRLVPGGQIARF